MWKIIDSISMPALAVVSVFMLLAPFRPMPHVVEKLIMLKNGTLTKPIDIFDLFFHLAPLALLVVKIVRTLSQK